MIFIAGCEGCNHKEDISNFKEKTISCSEKIKLLKKSVPSKKRIEELVIPEIKKDIFVSEINIFFDTSIVKAEINSYGKEGCCKYDFVYKESKDNKILELIRGEITFNYLWKETLKRWVEIKYKVEIKKQEDIGSIKGRVINGVTKDPVVGAVMYGEECTRTPHEYTLTCRTNNDGYFLIDYVSIGHYYVYGIKEGFLKNLMVNVGVKKEKVTNIGTIYLLPQETIKTTTVRGKVLDKSGNLIKEAIIYLKNTFKKEALFVTTTSSQGRYALSSISPGKYKVIAQKEDISNFINLTVTEEEVKEKQIIEAEDIILENYSPIISYLKTDQNILGVNEATTIIVKAKDIDQDKLYYYWNCDKGNFIRTCEEKAFWQTPSTEGNYKISVLVKDKKGGEANLSINIPIVHSIKTKDVLPVGLCYDGSQLYVVDGKTNHIRKIHPETGEITSHAIVSLPQLLTYFSGIACEGKYFYIADKANNKIYKISKKGELISFFNSPGHSPQGLAFDGKYLWNADYSDNRIYKINPENGEVITSFNSAGTSPRGLTYGGNYLWNSDSGSDSIYQIDPSTGIVITSFSTPRGDPRGIVYDRTYLWCADEGVAIIYKLNLNDYL